VIGLENVLDRIESWRDDWGRERGRDPGLYYFRVFGSPEDRAWGWRCGGHHLSVNYTITGGRVASCTPCFIGSNPAEVGLLAGGTLRPLGDIERIARELARDLDRRGLAAASLHRSAVSDIVSGNRPRVLGQPEDHRTLAITTQPKGVPGSELTPDERARLLLLVEGYVRRFPGEIADPWVARYRAGGDLAGLHFGYAGEPADRGPVYYRLQDQRLLVEYDNTQNAANHAHTVIRDLESDFGFDALAEHRQAFHRENSSRLER
jgi:hypothetical protein